jgi:cell division protein FtsN
MPYDFSLDRKGAITLSAGSVVLLVLVFVAGVLTGLTWRNPEQEIMAAAKPAVSVKPAAVTVMPPAPPKAAPPPQPAQSQPAQSMMPATPPPAPAPATAPAGATPASAPAAAAAAPSVPAVQLAIQVGAFLDKGNADKLVERLKEAGYTPQIVLGGHAPRVWNFVCVGPYHDWGEASQIAAVISRDQDTEAVVRPMH